MRGVWFALTAFAVLACDGGGGDGDPAPTGDGGMSQGDGGGAGAPGDGGPQADVCAPLVCPDGACGALEDGCGGVLDCGVCACDPARFGADCPQRPCELALGCEGGRCQYTPITCGGQVCRCLEGDCPDEAPRPCGLTACPTDYCDPAPEVVAGQIVFGNACVGPPEQPCGLCDLGRERCDAVAGVPVCTDITLPGLDPTEVECDSTRDGSTFVYVDADYDGGPGDGSRQAPFRSLNEAIAAAAARNVRGVVIGGAPTFTAPFQVQDGVSIYGGYTRGPDFLPTGALRPRVEVDPVHIADGRLVAVDAVDIERPTLLSNVVIRTPDLRREGSVTAYGIRAVRAPGLILVDVDVAVDHGGDGLPGEAGEPGLDRDADMRGQIGRDAGAIVTGDWCNAGNDEYLCDPDDVGEVLGGEGGAGTLCHDAQRSPAGGRGGPGRYTCPGPIPGDPGLPGVPREGPLVGAPGQAGGEVTAEGWWASAGHGEPGRVGAHGAGGRGGHGGIRPEGCALGASGGGGGAGGCGGQGGRGGEGGGWTFALFMVDSPGLQITRGRFAAGPGGQGAPGGPGGEGAPGGRGGLPGGDAPHVIAPVRGHDGVPGGPGGHGGNGAGGGSIAVLCHNGGPDVQALPELSAGLGGLGADGEGQPAPPGPSNWVRGCD